MIKGNEKDCICAKEKGKHKKYCDAYRISQSLIKASSTLNTLKKVKRTEKEEEIKLWKK